MTYNFEVMNTLEQVSFKTQGYQIVNITKNIQELIHCHGFEKGLVNLSILHTSASLTIQENASEYVLSDIKTLVVWHLNLQIIFIIQRGLMTCRRI